MSRIKRYGNIENLVFSDKTIYLVYKYFRQP